ncbi:MAG TPA: MG2 domain-containing protein, partial [Thiobacillaceae bacterium]|nr:MG2 domain-containing protein [Thiobacillaceae bacterium]
PADQRLEFQVRDHFVARLRCERENAKTGCMPLLPLRLDFSAPVARAFLDKLSLKDAKGKTYRQRKPEQPAPTDDSVLFPGPFPAGASLTLSLPEGFKDDKGRVLINAGRFPMTFQLADYPPLAKFSGEFGILERAAGGLLPITLRNLEPDNLGGTAAKVRWLRLVDDAAILDWQQSLKKFENPDYDERTQSRPDRRRAQYLAPHIAGVEERNLPKPGGPSAFEVVGLPLEKPGFYVVEAESKRLGKSLLGDNNPMFVRATALVTNLSVHFKWGQESSLAWVTRLDTGKPAAGAKIAVRTCKAALIAETVTDANGLALIPGKLPDPRNADDYACPLFVSARLGDDLSFARSDWNEGIETWRFGLPQDWGRDSRIAHSVLDRTLFRPGDTVHMKHILRDKQASGLAYPAKTPRTLLIEHEASQQRWFLPLTWKHGAAETPWTVPPGAKRGDYRLRLVDKAIQADTPPEQLEALEGLDSGRFSVGDFRVPLMKASLDPSRSQWVGAGPAEYDVAVGYLNGGGAKHLQVKLRAQLEPRFNVEFEEYPEFEFAQRKDLDNGQQEGVAVPLPVDPLTLDASGAGRARLDKLPALAMPHKLRLELEYADPAGEIQTVSRLMPWWPADVVIGLKNDHWAKAGPARVLEFQVVTPDGKPAAGAPVDVKLALRQILAHRVRLAGGFYGYRQETRERPLDATCTGKTDAKGRFACSVKTDRGGEVLVEAMARDPAGRTALSHHSFWVAGKEAWGFSQDNHDRIDLIPEQKRYEPGQNARFQVRMPFQTATVLVTVEREGILEARVVELSGKAPVIELPVKAAWAPNVFVSALAVRGRNDAVKPTALVDLGRPAFKLGLAGIQVGGKGNTLDVEVKTDRSTYAIREKAKVKVKVRGA